MTNATDRAVETHNRVVRDAIATALLRAYTSNYEGGTIEEFYGETEAVIAALDSVGLVIVPKEPTEAMVSSGSQAMEPGGKAEPWREPWWVNSPMAVGYRAMITAKDRG